MQIHVTPTDWSVARVRWHRGELAVDCCAVAVAVERATGAERGTVSVGRDYVEIDSPSPRRFAIPPEARAIAAAFDAESARISSATAAVPPAGDRRYGAFDLPI